MHHVHYFLLLMMVSLETNIYFCLFQLLTAAAVLQREKRRQGSVYFMRLCKVPFGVKLLFTSTLEQTEHLSTLCLTRD